MSEEFRQKLMDFARRSVSLSGHCTNEESTKLFLILPFLALLGYDDRNPEEVRPEHEADFSDKYKNRVDFAILRSGSPVIAIECKGCGSPLKDERGQLRAYFNAALTVKMGVLTNGLIYEFYADSDEPNIMDQHAFLSVDLRDTAKGKIEDSVLDGLRGLQKSSFDPENIGAEAKRKLVFQNMLAQLNVLADQPSEAFTRLLLQNAGLTHIKSKSLAEYQELVRGAFREFINVHILRRLDLPSRETEKSATTDTVVESRFQTQPVERVVTTETELAVFNFVKQRLAFLVKNEDLFREIDRIGYKDYQGKFVVFYAKERKGRIFDLVEGDSPKFRLSFADGPDVLANTFAELQIDVPLLATFLKRVEEVSNAGRAVEALPAA